MELQEKWHCYGNQFAPKNKNMRHKMRGQLSLEDMVLNKFALQ